MSFPQRNVPKIRKRVITVRYATPSRRPVAVIVAQSQDPLGDWLVPLITFEGFSQVILESGRFARDVGIALIVASHIYDEWMRDVKHTENGEDLSHG